MLETKMEVHSQYRCFSNKFVNSEVCLETCRTPMIKLFAKILFVNYVHKKVPS